jgi:thioredoxin reductase
VRGMPTHDEIVPESFDVAIVGGGPAGLSAALWLSRYLHSVALIDGGDPRNWETRGINGIIGQHGVRSPELRGRARDECRRYGATLVDATVESVESRDDEFLLTLADGTQMRSSRLLLAIGIRDVWPDLPGLERCYGETAHVCPDCDGYEAMGKKTVVIGNGRKAVGMALALTTWTSDIVICTNGDRAELDEGLMSKLEALNIPILEARIERAISQKGEVSSLKFEEGLSLDCDRVFFSIGQYAADDLGVQLGCKRDEHGSIVVDDRYHTSVRNVFAAGDIVPGPQLAVAAAADGAIAALAIHHSLVPPERLLD